MAQPQPITIKDFQKGIAPSPYLGFADMRNINVLTSPGGVSVGFKTSALNQPPVVSAVAYTAATNDTLTVASTSGYYNGMAVTLNTVVTAVGISTGRVYWIGDLTATTFKLYKNPARSVAQLADITTGGTGTFSSYTMSQPIDYAIDYRGAGRSPARKYVFILDDTGKVWWIDNVGGTLTSNLVYLANTTLTGTTGRAIEVFGSDIIVFRTSDVDSLAVSRVENDADFNSFGWSYAFDSVSSVPQTVRPTLVGQDEILYFGNGRRVGSFDASLVKDSAALDLPGNDDVESLGELGRYLLIGGTKNLVYPWDRVSPSFDFPITLSEHKTTRIVNANNLAYLFAGNRGNIYVTNGTAVSPFKKIPDHLTEVHNPHFTWNDALVCGNQLYFSFNALENDGDALATTGGVWAIDLVHNTLRFTNQLSYGAYTGTASVLIPHVLSSTPPGNGIYVGWSNSSTYGVDVSSSNFYTSYVGYLVSEMFLVGTAWHPRQLNKLFIELNRPLVTGQGIKVSFRTSLADSFTEIDTFDHADYPSIKTLEKTYQIQTEKIQIKAELTTAASTQPPELMAITLI